jgi:uncharacterized membrane protein YfcA
VAGLDPHALLIVSAGIFAGAVVSGLIGFAFSAVAGAVMLHVLPPTEAVPLLMACSIVTQAVSLVALRGSLQWRASALLIAGGALGIVPAIWLLHRVDAAVIRVGFGVFLVAYAAAMLLRPAAAIAVAARHDAPGRLRQAVVGFAGGLVGGLTAMPGALPTLWCDLRGLPKDQQRGLVQPYITAMQLIALAVLLTQNNLSAAALWHVTINLPALAAGAALGVLLFRRVSDASFRTVVLVALMLAGMLLVV